MRSCMRKAAAVFLSFFMALAGCGLGICVQAETPQRTVKFAYYYDGDFMYKNDAGEYMGYDVEYLYELSKYAGWEYQFVEYDSFESALAGVENGEADIIPALFKTEERQQKLLFSDKNMGSIYVTLIVPLDDTSHSYNDYASFDGQKIGILAGSEDGESFRRLAAEKNIQADIIEMHSSDELLKALDDGTLDAVAITYLGNSSQYRTVSEFSPMEMYFGMNLSAESIKTEMDAAMAEMQVNEPDFQTRIYNQYFQTRTAENPVFSKEESDYIATDPVIRVALRTDNAPYSYLDQKGNLAGAVVDLFEKISSMSGLKFQYVPAASVDEATKMIRDGEVDVIGKIRSDYVTAYDNNIRMTNPYMSVAMTELTRKGTVEINTVAVPVSLQTLYETVSARNGSTLKPVYYSSAKACFDALSSGEVDAVAIDVSSATYLLNSSRASDYTLNMMNGYDYSIAAGTSTSADTPLYAILNKCIRNISDYSVNELVLKHSTVSMNSLQVLLNRIPAGAMGLAVAVLAAAVIGLIILIQREIRHSRQERELAAQKLQTKAKEQELMVAEKANEQKSEFFGNLSHDMRTPLNGILGYADLAMNHTEDSGKVQDYLGKIKISGNLLLDLVNDTLTISKLENKKYDLHPESIDAAALLEETAVSVRAAAVKREVEFEVQTEQCGSRRILADRLCLQKIVLNLLTNAVKFTPAGGRVTLNAALADAGEGHAELRMEVSDTGIGISREFLPHIFDPFAQERTSGYDSAAGTGLGLSIVHDLVQLMNGTIAVESEKGRGTKFTVHLPVRFAAQKSEAAASAEAHTALKGRQVLICEDNAMNLEILQEIVQAEGILTLSARDGSQAVEAFARSKTYSIDAVLMDLRMPVMDGYEAAAKIRALDRPDAADVPIIAVSADAYAEDLVRCRASGMDSHISKPIQKEELFAALSEAFSARKNK